jgi:hypothetical protein
MRSKKIDAAIEVRRAKRALRREKQRHANIGRAKKMHIARLNFAGKESVPKSRKGRAPRIVAGCSGWFYWHWGGKFYPSGMPTNQWFGHYAEHFNTVELNASFYSWPTLATVHTWLRQVKDTDFIYTIKVCELITHIKRFRHTRELVKDFGLIADILGPTWDVFFFSCRPAITIHRPG